MWLEEERRKGDFSFSPIARSNNVVYFEEYLFYNSVSCNSGISFTIMAILKNKFESVD